MHMARIKRATVIANERKYAARKVKRQVLAFLGESHPRPSPRKHLIITVGGDGTVLFAKKYYGTPFFAIGSATSFICQANFSNWKQKLSSTLRHEKNEKRLMLSAKLNGKTLPPCLNEIGIRNPEPRVISIHLQIGKRHYAFRADGILFSTPTGSPAYAYSCGGKEMKKGERRYQAVAISPFRRLFKPAIIPAATSCTLRISGHEKAQLFVDGQQVGTFTQKDTLRIRGSKKEFLFAKA